MTDLLFKRPLPVGHPVDLTFGQPLGPAQDAAGRLEIVLQPFTASFEGRLAYDNAVSRSDVITVGAGWQAARPVPAAQITAPYAAPVPLPQQHDAAWGCGERLSAAPRVAWKQASPLRTAARMPWRRGQALPIKISEGPWQSGLRTPRSAAAPWRLAVPLPAGVTRAPSHIGVIVRRPPAAIPWGSGLPAVALVSLAAGPGDRLPLVSARIPWRWAARLTPGRTTRPVTPPLEPWRCYTPPPGDAANLLFDERLAPGTDILFSCGKGTPTGRVVPVLECYIVINSVSLVRADNGAEIPADALQLSIGSDGPHWSWSASVPGYARQLVEDRPEVIATLNGTPVRLVVERVRRDRRASLRGVSDALQVSGRSPSAWLSNPFAPATARTSDNPYTAQQLAAQALTINGVSMGWALDWRLPDWLVPAGAWSHLGTPMEAVLRIAEAGGGYIQAAAASQTLRALPHYPAAPWLWASLAPDLTLPEDVVEVEGTETADTAAYDVVYVEGVGPSGRRDRVRRTGTAGVLPAPQIIDPLATDPDMTRARGLAALAASGPQTRVTLRLPVLQETGLILPGTLLDYAAEGTTRRGVVRAFQADWTHPELWQSVEVECHG